MLKLSKSNLGLAAIALGAMLFVGVLISNHNKYKTTEVSLPANAPVATPSPAPEEKTTKKSVTRLRLTQDQVIFMASEINGGSVEAAINRIQRAENEGTEELYIVLDCPGGSVFDGARLTSYMDASTVKIHTVIYGLAASMCGHIFSHGKTRFMIDHSSTLMMHQASGGVQGPVKNMKHLLTYIEKEVNRLDAYVADRSKLSRAQYDELVSTDLWLSAQDAIDAGLADKLAVINVDGGLIPESGGLSGKTKNADSNINNNPLKYFR